MHWFCKRRIENPRGAAVLAAILGLALTCGVARAADEEELREWSDATGRHKLSARLEAFAQDTVTLKMADGKVMEIEIEKLDAKDRKYVLAHRANLKKADDNPFEEQNGARLARLEAKLKASRKKVEENAQEASENAAKVKQLEAKLEKLESQLQASQGQVDLMARHLSVLKLRAVAARTDALLLDRQFSKSEVGCLEAQVQGAEKNLLVQDSRVRVGTVTRADSLDAKAVLCTFRGCLAWVKGDLPQCQKEYDDAFAACKGSAEIARTQYRVGVIDYPTVYAAEAAAADAELCASRVKERIAARESRPSK